MHLLTFFLLGTICRHALAFNYPVCCREANSAERLFDWDNGTNTYAPLKQPYSTCGQVYSAKIPPARPIYITYESCRANCRGFDLTKIKELSVWAAPLIQFILPAIIFSLSIPRGELFVPMWNLHALSSSANGILGAVGYLLGDIAYGLILAILTAIDTIVWIIVILILAGPMMVSGLTEALLDIKILHAISSNKHAQLNDELKLSDESKLKLILSVVAGNLVLPDLISPKRHHRWSSLSGIAAVSDAWTSEALGRLLPQAAPARRLDRPDALEEISRSLGKQQDASIRQAQLLYLMRAQGDFGAIVGAPVAFFLGGFIYNIVDLLGNPNYQDPAVTLAFGVQWMIVVHVAIVSGCLFASNNPSAVCILNGYPTPPGATSSSSRTIYETRFQPVSILQRGSNKLGWLRTIADRGEDQRLALHRVKRNVRIRSYEYFALIIVPTMILISLPSAAGAVVAWRTPPVGWGCRSLTLVCYAASQLLVTILHELRDHAETTSPVFPRGPMSKTGWKKLMLSYLLRICHICEICYRWSLPVLYWTLCLFTLFTSLGGTILQVMGVYRNCLCYVNTPMWTRLDQAFVQVASDTYRQRHASQNWIKMGFVAIGSMTFLSYCGWWYQKLIRAEYRKQVENLYR